MPARLRSLAVLAALAGTPAVARADAVPSPPDTPAERPADWDRYPPPGPDLPPEKEWPAPSLWIALALLAAGLSLTSLRPTPRLRTQE